MIISACTGKKQDDNNTKRESVVVLDEEILKPELQKILDSVDVNGSILIYGIFIIPMILAGQGMGICRHLPLKSTIQLLPWKPGWWKMTAACLNGTGRKGN
jgi:hypothetical protein